MTIIHEIVDRVSRILDGLKVLFLHALYNFWALFTYTYSHLGLALVVDITFALQNGVPQETTIAQMLFSMKDTCFKVKRQI